MAERSSGNWWDGSWNPVSGCSPLGPGCPFCYACRTAATTQTSHDVPLYKNTTEWRNGEPVWTGKMTELEPGHPGWTWPLKWKGAEHPHLGPGQPSLIFVCSMCDLFHPNRPTQIIDRVVDTIALSDHIGLILDRNTERVAAYFQHRPDNWRSKFWIGFSAENQPWFERHWANIRPLTEQGWRVFVSISPMLGPLHLPYDFLELGNLVWAIANGEQYGKAPMDLAWPRGIRDQCSGAGVPFFFLHTSGRKPIPADLFVREFPQRAPAADVVCG